MKPIDAIQLAMFAGTNFGWRNVTMLEARNIKSCKGQDWQFLLSCAIKSARLTHRIGMTYLAMARTAQKVEHQDDYPPSTGTFADLLKQVDAHGIESL